MYVQDERAFPWTHKNNNWNQGISMYVYMCMSQAINVYLKDKKL